MVFSSAAYRYGFNGQEKENEVYNESTSAYFWLYESRLGRRLNLDPKPITPISLYADFVNNSIVFNDLLGDTVGVGNMAKKTQTTLLENWSKNKGMTLKIKEDESLDYERDRKGRPIVSTEFKSSRTARRFLISAINSKTKVEFFDRSDKPTAQQFDGDRNHINLNFDEIDKMQANCSPNMTKESLSVGLTAFHELYHWKTDRDDTKHNYRKGPIVKKVNRIEKELGLDQRLNYSYVDVLKIFEPANTTECPNKLIITTIIFFDQKSLDAIKNGKPLPPDGKYMFEKYESVPQCLGGRL